MATRKLWKGRNGSTNVEKGKQGFQPTTKGKDNIPTADVKPAPDAPNPGQSFGVEVDYTNMHGVFTAMSAKPYEPVQPPNGVTSSSEWTFGGASTPADLGGEDSGGIVSPSTYTEPVNHEGDPAWSSYHTADIPDGWSADFYADCDDPQTWDTMRSSITEAGVNIPAGWSPSSVTSRVLYSEDGRVTQCYLTDYRERTVIVTTWDEDTETFTASRHDSSAMSTLFNQGISNINA